jgi:hypothetical protein
VAGIRVAQKLVRKRIDGGNGTVDYRIHAHRLTPPPTMRCGFPLLTAAFCRLAGDCHHSPSVI